ncbi:hypothetical protein F2Q68_00012429 [Brassica cretica]|uniref:Uncharacterized protein n=1 Tax=Brassica cretica TaxID=69181 RepID=A0A8S9KWM1_BRACR|nr:hypothetical protein F2Q68_00012429 [Brassica cretica]
MNLAGLEEAEAFLQHRCLRTGGCAGRSHQNKISTIRVHAKKLKMSLVMFLIRRRRTKNLMFLINLAALNIQVKEGDRRISHMPKSDDLSPKKQKPIALGLQCCLKTSTLLGYSVSE